MTTSEQLHIFPFTSNFKGPIDNSKYLSCENEMLVHGRRVKRKSFELGPFQIIEWSSKSSKEILPDIIALKTACELINKPLQ